MKPNTPTRKASMTFMRSVYQELQCAREEHAPLYSRHEAYAVILEELEEFKELVFSRRPRASAMHDELVQVAAMCWRTVLDLKLQPTE